jgi:phage terminase large subunit-like protein
MTPIPVEVEEYIKAVENGEINSCEEQKQLCEYLRNVFATEKLFVDYERMKKYLAFQQYFEWDLLPWEKCLVVLLLCVFDDKKRLPRFSELLVLCGRGAGKNGFLAYLGFCMISPANDIPYYFVDICANSEDQAKTTFDDLYNILETPKHTKKLSNFFNWTKEEITCKQTRSKLKFRTNNPKGKDGLRSGAVFFDEIHAYQNWENINVFTTGLGKKPHPRKVYVTTNGDVRDGVLDALIDKSKKILDGDLPDNGFLPFICKLDSDDEVHNPDLWEKANPSLPNLPTLKEQMRREYADYLLDPVVNNAFMTKRMNRPQGNKDAEVTSWDNILKTNGEVPDLKGKYCVCGIDFSKTTDFVSAFLLFKDKDKYYGIHHSWFCSHSNDKHRIKVPLHEAVAKGKLTIVDDVEISPEIVADWIKQQKEFYNIEKIAIDSYRFTVLSRALRDAGFDANYKEIKLVRPSDIMQVVQKISSMFTANKIIWGDDMLMRWFTRNTKLEAAPNNNFKYGKIEPKSRKTDGFMAFVNAVTLEDELPDQFEYQTLNTILL